MKHPAFPLLAAGILLCSCATSSPTPVIQAAASENVIVPTRESGKELQLPAILHRPVGDGPFAAVVMLCGQGGWAGGGRMRSTRPSGLGSSWAGGTLPSRSRASAPAGPGAWKP